MLEITTLLKGLAIGLLMAIPVGPVGVLCIQRTLDRGKLSGFISGLGAATVDAFYGAIAAFGLMIIFDFLVNYQLAIQLVGVLVLLYLGIKAFFGPQKETISIERGTDIITDYFSTLLLTATNPTTVVTFTALFAVTVTGFSSVSYDLATILVIGVFFGSSLWWFILSLGIEYISLRMGSFSLVTINKISGIITILFAIAILMNVSMNFALGPKWYNSVNYQQIFRTVNK
ncbi:MAG: LysE family transporter [Patescibacteria group bacterium]